MCVHVDDIMISGLAEDPEFRRMMDEVRRLYEWSEWERHDFDQCRFAEYDRQRRSSSLLLLIRRPTLERWVSSRCLHIDAHTSQRQWSKEEHTTLMAKRGELN